MDAHIETVPVTIAFAEDHQLMREGLLSLLLPLGGIKLLAAVNNGKELIDALENLDELPDICILDIQMPLMNGFETIDYIRSKWPSINVLILTATDEELYVIRMLRAGAKGYMLKDIGVSEIKKALITIKDGGMYYPEISTRKLVQWMDSSFTKLPQFTERELAFLRSNCSGMTYMEMAKEIGCTKKSIEGLRDSLFKKLNVNSRVELAMFAVRVGIVPIVQSSLP